MNTIPEHIFKSYDIRGLADTELSEEMAYRLGRAFVWFLKEQGEVLEGKKIVVGRDMRPTSGPFGDALVKGLTESGMDIIEIGQCTTPLFNFVCADVDEHVGGIMVTASHNPAQYNGFKMTRADGLAVGKGSGMEQIRDAVLANEFGPVAEEVGTVEEKDLFSLYEKALFELVPKESIEPRKIVIDGGNGMGSVTFDRVLASLPQIEVTWLYKEPDGSFPNHEANPLKVETLKDLQEKVKELGADFGFALDGDGDRLGLVDENGNVVDASFVAALMGLEVLKAHPGAGMSYDLRSSRIVKEVWEEAGAKTEMSMVGHANIKKMMREQGLIFGSELSLHLYFGDMHMLEATDLSLLYVLRLLTEKKKPLSEIVAPLKKYYHSGEINFEVEDKDAAIEKVRAELGDSATSSSDIDGLWLEFDWGWLSLRKSNTEPVLRLNLETWAEEDLEPKIEQIKGLLGV